MKRFVAPFAALLLLFNVAVASAASRPSASANMVSTAALASDFNGDGFGDLAVAAPQESIGTVVLAGAVNVFYGSASGIVVPGNQFWSQASAGVADTPESSDAFGTAVAAGDFNADGFADLAIGVPTEDLEGATTIADAGALQILYGSATGLTKVGNQFFTQSGTDPDAVPEEGDRFGSAVATGDVNGDGFADVAVGAPDEAVGSTGFAGAVSVLFGSASGLSATGEQFWSQDSPGILDAAEFDDTFGSALAVAQLGNGPESDLAVGVPLEAVGSVINAGAVNVLYGSPTGLTDVGNQVWTQDTGTVKETAEDSDLFGSALAGGDFDADGVADLAVGVPRESIGTTAQAGAVNVLYGTVTGLSDARNQLWSQASPGIQQTPNFLDRFGTAVAAGDFDGDGDADLGVGVPGEPAPGGASAGGAVNVIYGAPSTGLTNAANRFLWQDTAGFDDKTEPSDSFGRALFAADFGLGAQVDLAVGIPEEEDGGAPTAAGAFQMVYGSAVGLAEAGNVMISQDTPGVKDACEVDDLLGSALA